MSDFFNDFQALDITMLTENKANTDELHPVTKGTGRFGVAEDTVLEKDTKVLTPEEIEANKKTVEAKESEDAEALRLIEVTKAEEIEKKRIADGGEPIESPSKLISSFLREKGIVDYTDEEFKDNDDFIAEVVDKTTNKKSAEGIQAYKDGLPEEIKQLIENYEEGVPLGQLLEHEQKEFELSSITPERIKEDSRLQENIVEAYLSNIDWSKEEITEHIKGLQDAGIIEKEAVKLHGKLIQMDKTKKEQTIKQAQAEKKAHNDKYQAQIAQLQNTIKEKKEFFEGIITNDMEKKAVFDAITKYDKNGRNKISQLLNNPEIYLKTAYFLEILKGDISKLKTAAKTASVKDTLKKIDTTKPESRFNGKNLDVLNSYLKTKQSLF